MGLLDDAIREHLELKRRSGADAGEVERLEHEALGPARREPEEPGIEPEAAAADEPDAYLPTPADEEVQSLAEDEEPFYDDDLLGEAGEADDEGEPEPPAADAGSITDQPTVQFDVAALHEHEHEHEDAGIAGPGAPHDELEDTPEFLQETPEHDRLWFDQKPPRDFDF